MRSSKWTGYFNVAMDRTDFDADGQATIMLSLLTQHGRATPLLWLTVDKSTLKNRRNEYEYQALVRLADALPADIKVAPLGRADVDRSHAHAETRVLGVAQPAFDAPATGSSKPAKSR